jgi:hypothetical protein
MKIESGDRLTETCRANLVTPSLHSLFLVVKQHKVELPSDNKNKIEEYHSA